MPKPKDILKLHEEKMRRILKQGELPVPSSALAEKIRLAAGIKRGIR